MTGKKNEYNILLFEQWIKKLEVIFNHASIDSTHGTWISFQYWTVLSYSISLSTHVGALTHRIPIYYHLTLRGLSPLLFPVFLICSTILLKQLMLSLVSWYFHQNKCFQSIGQLLEQAFISKWWSHIKVMSLPERCGPLSLLQHSDLISVNNTPGGEAIYKCRYGYAFDDGSKYRPIKCNSTHLQWDQVSKCYRKSPKCPSRSTWHNEFHISSLKSS